MKLRRKTVAIIVICLAFLITTFYFISQYIFINNLEETEEKRAGNGLVAAQKVLNSRMAEYSLLASDWGACDIFYQLVQSHQINSVRTYFTDQILQNHHLDAALLFDRSGKLLYSCGYDLDKQRQIPVSRDIIREIAPEANLINYRGQVARVSGIMMLGGKPAIVAYQAVLPGSGSGASLGCLVLVSYLDQAAVDEMGQQTPDGFELLPYRNQNLFRQGPNVIQTHDKTAVVGYTRVEDLYGHPCLTIKVTIPRTESSKGRVIVNFFLAAMMLSGFIIGLLQVYLMDRAVLRQLRNLGAGVKAIADKGTHSERLKIRGHDELAELGSSINAMLKALEKSQLQLAANEERYRYLSQHDNLTGLYNRHYFNEEMERRQQENQPPLGLIVCDVDGLKLVNDIMGHHQGDKLLRAAANVLKQSLPPGATLARMGGDEFAILLPGSQERQVIDTVVKIRDELSFHNSNQPEVILSISLGWAVQASPPLDIRALYSQADSYMYHNKTKRAVLARGAIVSNLVRILKERNGSQDGHLQYVQDLLTRVAGNLGWTDKQIEELKLLADFHDIGQVMVPEHILTKRSPLTIEERAQIRKHSEIGYRIAQSSPELLPLAEHIFKHHEWWNGGGYPQQLKGEQIPPECRLMAVVEAYDAMTSERPYRPARSKQEAIEELRRCAGIQFDPEMVEAVIAVLESEE